MTRRNFIVSSGTLLAAAGTSTAGYAAPKSETALVPHTSIKRVQADGINEISGIKKINGQIPVQVVNKC